MLCLLKLISVKLLIFYTFCNGNDLMINFFNIEEERVRMVVDIINYNWKNNGWTNLFTVGNFSDSFFTQIRLKSHSLSITDFTKKYHSIKRIVPYHSNTIVLNCSDFYEFEAAIKKTVNTPYWHPLSNMILYYRSSEKKEVIAKIFFIFWYYRAINVIIIHYDDSECLLVSQFNPFTCDNSEIQNRFSCWTARKLNMPVNNFEQSFICKEGCNNVSLKSELRVNNLGCCLGFDTYHFTFNNKSLISTLKLFKDKAKNLQGCILRAFAVEVLPFLEIHEHANDSFTLHARDGEIWNTMAERMNFSIDLSASKDIIKQEFNFEHNILQVFAFIQRKVDLLLYPLYQFDLMVAEVDNTIAFKESGVCFISHRAGYETIIFDERFVKNNANILMEFFVCFFCTWFVFSIFNAEQFERFSLDQFGKDLMNTFRTILSISLRKPPKQRSFRIFLTIAIWSFFVINFTTQAAIISIFSAHKRGKEVDTMDDVLEKGYPIEGVASPDIILPDDEEKYRMINSRRVFMQDLYGCVKAMNNDSHRFCVNDCAVGRYLERNRLNSKGQQYLHVATGDRIHSHYLNMIFHRHSPLTGTYNKIILALIEGGLITKWEEYRFNDIKEDAPVKSLTMDDVIGIFKCYGILVGTSICIFCVEIAIGIYIWGKNQGIGKFQKWTATFIKQTRRRKKQHNLMNTGTQTI